MKDTLTPDMRMSLMNVTEGQVQKVQKSLQQKAAKNVQNNEAYEAAVDFEAVFISEMMKPMFEGISTEAPFGGGKGEEVFRSMLLQEYGKLIAQTGSIGLSDGIKTEIIRMQAQVDAGGDLIEEHESQSDNGMEPLEVTFKSTKQNILAQEEQTSDATEPDTKHD